MTMDWTTVRGFNYQPSYGTSGLELWQKFSPGTIARELGLGKKCFPGMNAIRLWLSWDAFKRNPRRFTQNVGIALDIAAAYGLQVMPVLFNRWHDSVLDYGGTYIDHFVPGASWVQSTDMFRPYLDAIVGGHADDPRILAWDLCNEPFAYGCSPDSIPEIVKNEYAWLEGLYRDCQRLGAKAPITVGVHQGHEGRWTEGTAPGNLAFIEADGTLRPGHDIFNEF